MQERIAHSLGPIPGGLDYSRRVFGGPWPQTAKVRADGAVFFPVAIFRVRWQWWLRYAGTDKQVLVGDQVKVRRVWCIVGEIRMGGRVRVDYADKQTWVAPAAIGASWVECRSGKVVHEYGDRP
ncbi:MAG: hypothetical protein U1A72_17030 [Sulfuritalea sp.]|nr:hypothetical protein [Sulfuritalea sp.]